jgi:DNA helicase II / ATP-dependent DNA helicase PcrA
MPNTFKIIGPPGTGKTTYLLSQIEAATKKYDPDRIGAISFTKAAVVEMRNRVSSSLGMSHHSAKNIRTIHSHCYRLLGLTDGEIVTEDSKHIKSWNEAFPKWALPTSGIIDDLEDGEYLDTDEYSSKENKKLYARMNIYRGRCLPPEQWLDESVLFFYRDWMDWLKQSGLWDFTMTLEEILRQGSRPDIDCLFIDEAQDLSTLQLKVAGNWGAHCESIVISGDEDQTIYKFLGAQPEDFRAIPTFKILSQSYRVSRAVHEYSQRLIQQIKDREQVEYYPTDHKGGFERYFFPELDLPGSHMILTRTNYGLKRWKKRLSSMGHVWSNPYRIKNKDWNPCNTKTWAAALTYDRLKSGLNVSGEDIMEMVGKMSSQFLERGIKTNRKKIISQDIGPMTKVDVFRLSQYPYFKADFWEFNQDPSKIFNLTGQAGDLIREHGASITQKTPKVIIGTIHSVKGGEADHVWVDTSSSPNILRAIHESEDSFHDEVRLAYVAATRARTTLGLLHPYGPASPVWV